MMGWTTQTIQTTGRQFMFKRIRQWFFTRKMDKLFRKLIEAEAKLARIELAKRYFLPEPLAELPPPKKARKPRAIKPRGDIPMRITYD